jgi:hypothetical protein
VCIFFLTHSPGGGHPNRTGEKRGERKELIILRSVHTEKIKNGKVK